MKYQVTNAEDPNGYSYGWMETDDDGKIIDMGATDDDYEPYFGTPESPRSVAFFRAVTGMTIEEAAGRLSRYAFVPAE